MINYFPAGKISGVAGIREQTLNKFSRNVMRTFICKTLFFDLKFNMNGAESFPRLQTEADEKRERGALCIIQPLS